MDITQTNEGDALVVSVSGRLNTSTAPELDKKLASLLGDTEHLVLDFVDLVYISSAGLRVVLSTQKSMTRKGGTLVVRHVKPEIMEVFEMTGFVDFLTIE